MSQSIANRTLTALSAGAVIIAGSCLAAYALAYGIITEGDRQCSVGELRGDDLCPRDRAVGRWGAGGEWNWERDE